jgi:hypothetical protein
MQPDAFICEIYGRCGAGDPSGFGFGSGFCSWDPVCFCCAVSRHPKRMAAP